MKIYIGADHRGFELKDKLEVFLLKRDYLVEDVGALTYDEDDDFAKYAVAAALKTIGSSGDDPRAILMCGGGQGMAMAANKIRGIRAVVVSTTEDAKLSRKDNDANVLCLSANQLDESDDWQEIVEIWLKTPFDGDERFVRRNNQLDQLS